MTTVLVIIGVLALSYLAAMTILTILFWIF